MENNSIVKFLTPFVLAVLYMETMARCADPTDAEKMLAHIRQGRHWDFLWFNGVNGKNFSSGEISTLEMISPLLGCAYGVNLNWFLLLSLVAIEECDNMHRNNDRNASHCQSTLLDCIKRGKFFISKLMRVLLFTDIEIDQDVENDQFYQVLKPLEEFLTGQVDIAFNGIVPGSLGVYNLLKSVAVLIENFLNSTCLVVPGQLSGDRTFNLPALRSLYRGNPNYIYIFYVDMLKSYIEVVNDHLLRLGFHYKKVTDTIVFDPHV